MSSIKLSPNASGTGIFTVAAPNSNTDRTLTLPDSTGTIATAESTLSQFNASGSAPVYAARAWVNFNGTGTVAIRGSGNVSSITDINVGEYAINFTTAMSDANYSVSGTSGVLNGVRPSSVGIKDDTTPTTSSFTIQVNQHNAGQRDENFVCLSIFR